METPNVEKKKPLKYHVPMKWFFRCVNIKSNRKDLMETLPWHLNIPKNRYEMATHPKYACWLQK